MQDLKLCAHLLGVRVKLSAPSVNLKCNNPMMHFTLLLFLMRIL